MKYATAALVGAAAAGSAHHSRGDEEALFDIGGITDLVILDFFDGIIDIWYDDSDRERYDACYQIIPKMIKDSITLYEKIDWANILDW